MQLSKEEIKLNDQGDIFSPLDEIYEERLSFAKPKTYRQVFYDSKWGFSNIADEVEKFEAGFQQSKEENSISFLFWLFYWLFDIGNISLKQQLYHRGMADSRIQREAAWKQQQLEKKSEPIRESKQALTNSELLTKDLATISDQPSLNINSIADIIKIDASSKESLIPSGITPLHFALIDLCNLTDLDFREVDSISPLKIAYTKIKEDHSPENQNTKNLVNQLQDERDKEELRRIVTRFYYRCFQGDRGELHQKILALKPDEFQQLLTDIQSHSLKNFVNIFSEIDKKLIKIQTEMFKLNKNTFLLKDSFEYLRSEFAERRKELKELHEEGMKKIDVEMGKLKSEMNSAYQNMFAEQRAINAEFLTEMSAANVKAAASEIGKIKDFLTAEVVKHKEHLASEPAKLKEYPASEAAKLKEYLAAENAKYKEYLASEAAKLKEYLASEAAKFKEFDASGRQTEFDKDLTAKIEELAIKKLEEYLRENNLLGNQRLNVEVSHSELNSNSFYHPKNSINPTVPAKEKDAALNENVQSNNKSVS